MSAAHPAVKAEAQRIVEEYENGDSLEVICAHDADNLECLIQAVEYREQGCSHVQPRIDSSLSKLKTASARALAEAALHMTSIEWQKTCLPGTDLPGGQSRATVDEVFRMIRAAWESAAP